jgi:hypothetical protein
MQHLQATCACTTFLLRKDTLAFTQRFALNCHCYIALIHTNICHAHTPQIETSVSLTHTSDQRAEALTHSEHAAEVARRAALEQLLIENRGKVRTDKDKHDKKRVVYEPEFAELPGPHEAVDNSLQYWFEAQRGVLHCYCYYYLVLLLLLLLC